MGDIPAVRTGRMCVFSELYAGSELTIDCEIGNATVLLFVVGGGAGLFCTGGTCGSDVLLPPPHALSNDAMSAEAIATLKRVRIRRTLEFMTSSVKETRRVRPA
jgi:hypothetical protein